MEMSAGDIVFIDDNPTYVRGGIDAGLISLHLEVTNPDQVFDTARRYLQLD